MPQLVASRVRRWRRRASGDTISTRPWSSAPLSRWRRSPMTFISGASNQNVEPRPTSDTTSMRPPIRSTMRRQIARPSPVPPYRRVVEASAWLKEWNRRWRASSSMPMPVSRTSKRSRCCAAVSPSRRTTSVTEPRSVNLMALPTRLVSTWRRRTGSPRTGRRTAGSSCRLSRRPLFSAGRCISCSTPSSSSRRLNPVISRSSLFASSLE